MKHILASVMLLGLALPHASYSESVVTVVTLKDSQKILAATAINDAIDNISKKVIECMSKKLAPDNECFCLYPEDIKNFNLKVNNALIKYPEWENKIINWQLNDEPMGYHLSISGLRKQQQMKCN